MGGKKKYIEMFGSFMEPFNSFSATGRTSAVPSGSSLGDVLEPGLTWRDL